MSAPFEIHLMPLKDELEVQRTGLGGRIRSRKLRLDHPIRVWKGDVIYIDQPNLYPIIAVAEAAQASLEKVGGHILLKIETT